MGFGTGDPWGTMAGVEHSRTTLAIQGYLDELAGVRGDEPSEPVVRALLSRSVDRLHGLCAALLYRSYPRLTHPPMNLDSEEMLGAIVERLIKALREARPATVKQFFAIANQHMRWELNGLARTLDEWRPPGPINDSVAAPESSGSPLTPTALRIFRAIDALPEIDREAFDLVRVQGLTHGEAADILGVSTKTVQRRLNSALIGLSETLGDLAPPHAQTSVS